MPFGNKEETGTIEKREGLLFAALHRTAPAGIQAEALRDGAGVIIINYETVGRVLIISGSVLGIVGGVVNALLYHDLAIDIWLFSNFFLLVWAVGYIREKWNQKLSIEYIAAMYLVFTICNVYAVLTR